MFVSAVFCALFISITFSHTHVHTHIHKHHHSGEEGHHKPHTGEEGHHAPSKSSSSETESSKQLAIFPNIAEDGTLQYFSVKSQKKETWAFENNDEITVHTWRLVLDVLDIIREADQSSYVVKKDSKLSFHKEGEDGIPDVAIGEMNTILQGAFNKHFRITIARPIQQETDTETQAKTDEVKPKFDGHKTYANMIMNDEQSWLHAESSEFNDILTFALQKARRKRIIARLNAA